MTVQIVHIGDLHFGGLADVPVVEALERMLPDLPPTLTIPGGAVIASALTAHGVAWGSLTARLRDIAVKGHLPKSEMQRVQSVFANADAGLPRVLVIHHNLLRGEMSHRMGR